MSDRQSTSAASIPERPCVDCTHDYCRCAAASAASSGRLWVVATPDGKYARIVRSTAATGALLSRVKDEDDVPKGGVWAVWALGNFPEQFEVRPDNTLRVIGRPSVKR